MTDRFLPGHDDEAKPDSDPRFAASALLIGVLLLAFFLPMVDTVPECSPFQCFSRSGTFISDNGTFTRTGVHVVNGLPETLRQGDRIRALDLGDPHEVFTSEGRGGYPIAPLIWFGATGLGAIGLGLTYLWRRGKAASRRRRR